MSTDIRFEDRKLFITRVYSAPREAVFEAWVETSKVEQWWGSAQTTSVRSEIELRVGGKYNHLMTIAGAGEYSVSSIFTEYDPLSRLAFASEASETDPAMKVSVDFLEHPDGTEVRFVHEGLPDEFVEDVRGGWTAAFGKLDAFLKITPRDPLAEGGSGHLSQGVH